MKPTECRRLALAHDLPALQQAAEHLSDETEPVIEVEGEDFGNKLTHVLLAQRIRQRIDAGEDAKDAFRAVMAEVRTVVSNT